jgi:hypothetical protein
MVFFQNDIHGNPRIARELRFFNMLGGTSDCPTPSWTSSDDGADDGADDELNFQLDLSMINLDQPVHDPWEPEAGLSPPASPSHLGSLWSPEAAPSNVLPASASDSVTPFSVRVDLPLDHGCCPPCQTLDFAVEDPEWEQDGNVLMLDDNHHSTATGPTLDLQHNTSAFHQSQERESGQLSAAVPDANTTTVPVTKLRSCTVFKPCKRGRQEEEQKEGWNINARCRAGGIPAMTARYVEKDAKNARMDLQLGTVTKKLASPDIMLTFCMNVIPGGVPLAKWPIPEIAKELKIMEDLRLFSTGFAPNTRGIIHPYLKFSSVDIPIDDFDNFVLKTFPNWAKKNRAFYNFASSVGLSKCPQVNEAGQRVVTLTFCPPAYNNNLARLCTAHGRKPKITPTQCADACCHGKWTPELWKAVLTRR